MLLGLASCSQRIPPPLPPPSERPACQLDVAGNACGPASLVNSLRYASLPWRKALSSLNGPTDRCKMIDLIRWQGMKPSNYTKGKTRWSKSGVSLADLADMASGMTTPFLLGPLTHQIDFRRSSESPQLLLKRTHRRFCRSLSAGFPPILSIRRVAWNSRPSTNQPPRTIDAHFVTLISISSLDAEAGRFQITCIDPWHGKTYFCTIQIPDQAVFPDSTGQTSCLGVLMPHADIGKSAVMPNEDTTLILGGSIGSW